MEGVIPDEVLKVQAECVGLGGYPWSLADWTKDMVVKLIEITHGQQLYRNNKNRWCGHSTKKVATEFEIENKLSQEEKN